MDSKTVGKMLREFHETYGLVVNDEPIDFSFEAMDDENCELMNLRSELNREEWKELNVAWEDENLVEYVDAVCDLVYVLVGSLVSFGVDFDRCFAEVHRSNMSKLENGKPVVRGDGKILKGKDWSPPDLRGIIYG